MVFFKHIEKMEMVKALQQIPKTYRYIAKNGNGKVYAFKTKPVSNGSYWSDGNSCLKITEYEHYFLRFTTDVAHNIEYILRYIS